MRASHENSMRRSVLIAGAVLGIAGLCAGSALLFLIAAHGGERDYVIRIDATGYPDVRECAHRALASWASEHDARYTRTTGYQSGVRVSRSAVTVWAPDQSESVILISQNYDDVSLVAIEEVARAVVRDCLGGRMNAVTCARDGVDVSCPFEVRAE